MKLDHKVYHAQDLAILSKSPHSRDISFFGCVRVYEKIRTFF